MEKLSNLLNNYLAVKVESGFNDTEIKFEGIVLRFDFAPDPGQVIVVKIRATDELEDPELRVLQYESPLPTLSEEATFFSSILLREMGIYLPEVGVLLPADLSNGWETLSDIAKKAVRAKYHLYLMLREHTRRFLMETNNIVLDLEIGKTPSLEEFKRLHRAVDVLKELEESARRELENIRRKRRLEQGELGDPDIEQVTVVKSAPDLHTVVGTIVNADARDEAG